METQVKRTLEISSALVYNLLRKVVGIEVSDCPQYENYLEIASRLGRRDAISFVLGDI